MLHRKQCHITIPIGNEDTGFGHRFFSRYHDIYPGQEHQSLNS